MTTEWEMEVETEYFEAPSRNFNEMLVEDEKFNPWDVKSLDIFCVYHCPECDYQQADHKMFRDHAIYIHDLAKLIWSQKDDINVKSVANYPRLAWTDSWEDESDIEEEENSIAIDWEAKKLPKPITKINEKKSDKCSKMQEKQVPNDFSDPEQDLPSNLPEKFPKAKPVKVMKVEKQNDGTFLCLLCFNFFDDLSDVHKHVPFCGKPKTAEEALKLENLETFTCIACDLSFDTRRKIDKHYRDPKCLKVQQLIVEQAAKLKDPGYWKKIQSEKRGPKKGAVYSKCRNCMEEFPNMKELDRHLATHTNCSKFSRRKKETEQKCEPCGKSFSDGHGHRRHIFYNHTENPKNDYHCEICDKYFFSRSDLKVHTDKVHGTGEIVQCEECEEAFITEKELRQHRKIHIFCKPCGKTFHTKRALHRHNAFKHQDPSKRTCVRCNLLCTNSAELYKHYENEHPNLRNPVQVDGVMVHKCEICHIVMASRTRIIQHYTEKHKRLMEVSNLDPTALHTLAKACEFCHEILPTPILYIDHIVAKHSDQPMASVDLRSPKQHFLNLKCTDCPMVLKNDQRYYIHRKELHSSLKG